MAQDRDSSFHLLLTYAFWCVVTYKGSLWLQTMSTVIITEFTDRTYTFTRCFLHCIHTHSANCTSKHFTHPYLSPQSRKCGTEPSGCPVNQGHTILKTPRTNTHSYLHTVYMASYTKMELAQQILGLHTLLLVSSSFI